MSGSEVCALSVVFTDGGRPHVTNPRRWHKKRHSILLGRHAPGENSDGYCCSRMARQLWQDDSKTAALPLSSSALRPSTPRGNCHRIASGDRWPLRDTKLTCTGGQSSGTASAKPTSSEGDIN